MFKNLKDKIAQVNKTAPTVFSGVTSPDSTSLSKESRVRTSSITSREENLENERSRQDSASSDVSQFSLGPSPNTSMHYVSPVRTHAPPSDIESEYGGDESDHESNTRMIKMQKLLSIYKNKFSQLKNAYDEVEREKDHIKDYLQQYQDTSLKRMSELREQTKLDRQTKEQLECLHKKEIRTRENRIEELTLQVNAQKDLIQLPTQLDHDEMQNLRDKNSQLQILLNQCKDAVTIHQDKQNNLTKQRDVLLQQLEEKQTVIESLMKDRHPEETSPALMDVQENFDSDITNLLQDKQRLQEQLDSTRLLVQELDNKLQLSKEQHIKIEEDNQDKNQQLTKNSEYIERLKSEIQLLHGTLAQEKEQRSDTPTNELQPINEKQQSDDEINQLKVSLTKLQQERDESALACVQLNQLLTNQRQEHVEEMAKLVDGDLKQLQEENRRLQSEIDEILNIKRTSIQSLADDHRIAIESLKTQLNSTYQEQISSLEEELKTEIIRQQDKINELNTQNSQGQEEIDRFQKLNADQELQLKEQTFRKEELEIELDKLKSQADFSDKQLTALNTTTKELEDKQKEVNHLTTVIDELKTTSAETQNKYQAIEEELEQNRQTNIQLNTTMEQRNTAVNAEQDRLQKQLEEKQNEVDRLTGVISELKTTSADIQNKYQVIEKELEERYQTNTELKTIIQQRQLTSNNEQERLQQQLAENENEVNRLTSVIDGLKTTNTDIQNKYQTLEKELEENRQMNNELNITVEERFNKQLKDKTMEVDRLTSVIDELKTASAEIQNKKQEIEKELEDSRQTKAELKATVQQNNEAVSHEHERLNCQLRDKQNQINELNEALNQLKSNNVTLVNEREHIDRQLERAQTEVSELKKIIDDVNVKNAEVIEEREQMTKQLQEKETEFAQLVENIDQMKASNISVNDKSEQLKRELDEKQNEIDSLKGSMNDDQQRIQDQLIKNETERSNLITAVEELKKLNQTIIEEREGIRGQLEERQNEVIQLNNTIEKLRTTNGTIIDRFKEQKKKLQEKEDEINRQTKVINEINNQYQQIEKELAEHRKTIDSEREELQKQLNDKETTLSRLTITMNEIQTTAVGEHQLMKQQLDAKQNEVAELNRTLEQTRATHVSIEEKSKELEEKVNEIAKLQSHSDKLKDAVVKINEKRKEQEKLIEELKTTMTAEGDQLKQIIQTFTDSQKLDQQSLAQKDKEIEILKQNLFEQESLSNSLTSDHQSHIDRLTNEHQQKLLDLECNYSKAKSSSESDLTNMINEKNEEIDHLHQQLQSERSQSDSSQETIEHLRRELQENEKKFSEQTSHLDQLLDQQNRTFQSMVRLKNVLAVDAKDDDELLDQLVHKMEQSQISNAECERLNNDLTKHKAEQTKLRQELQQLEQKLDENKEELQRRGEALSTNRTKSDLQVNQLNQAFEEVQKEKQSLEVQLEDLRSELEEKSNQSVHLQSQFSELTIEKDERTLKYQHDLHEQQLVSDNLRRELNDLHDELKTKSNEILSFQTNLDRCQQILQTKIDQIEQSSVEKDTLREEHQQLTEAHAALEEKFHQNLAEKAGLENELDQIRVQMQTTESHLNKRKQDNSAKLEQIDKNLKELQTERDSLRTENETFQSEILSLRTLNEDLTRRIDEFDARKSVFEEELMEKDRQLAESSQKIQELELSIKETQENTTKLRKALYKMKETIANNDQTHRQELELRVGMVTEEYDQKLKEQEGEYSAKLKSFTREITSQMEEKEKQSNQQLQELIDKSYQNEADIKQRIENAELRAFNAEERLKGKGTDDQINDLRAQIETLTNRENNPIQTTDHACQTILEDPMLHHSRTNSNDSLHSFIIESTETDYLKQIVLAYMTGTDRVTMAKVICALLRYTDDEKSLIIEHEKLRQTRWLNTSR